MPRIRLPKDSKYRAARALSSLKKPGVGAACFWCGHPYRSGEYSPETESDHLLQCPEFPQDGKRRMQKRKDTKPRPASRVGIVYFVGGKLFIDSTPAAQAGTYGDCLFHERDHYQYWAQLVSTEDVPDVEYEEHPRGRVAYNRKTGKYTLLADRCILGRKSLVRKILSGMNLPVGGTQIDTDSHYRCYRCLGPRKIKQ
jgi:hypothetical protein